MATLALTAGAVLLTEAGTFAAFAATAAAAVAGSYIDSMLFAPEPSDVVREGSRMEDIKVQTSAFGRSIAGVRGNMRLAGNVIWALDIREEKVVSETEVGGGKGGGGSGSVTNTTYRYYGTFAISICEGPISDVVAIWADTKVYYNIDTDDADTLTESEKRPITIYRGTEDQMPDPLIEADKGVGNVPAHRGLAYIVFDDIPLADYGNRIPSFSFQVQA